MIAQHYKDMLGSKSVIRQISEWSTARGAEIGYENVFDYSLGNPSVPCPPQFTAACADLLAHTDPVRLHGYTPTLTLPSARKAVAESLNRRFGMDYTADHIFGYIELDEQHAIIEVAVPEDWRGYSIGELDIRRKYGANILGVKRDSKTDVNISPETVLDADMTLLVLEENQKLKKHFRL